MTTPRWSRSTPYGRLYITPGAPEPRNLDTDAAAAIAAGHLVPSVTNVIGILDKPHLRTWYAKMAAQNAVDTAREHPGLMESKPYKAVKHFKEAAPRYTQKAASLGDHVHNVCEALARSIDPGPISATAQPYVDAWHQFRDDFQVEFLHLEATCFGDTPNHTDPTAPLGYAGTADFIARINGLTVVGDLKTGRSVHTEAALQASALAHTHTIVGDDDTTQPAPDIEAGLIVHLTPTGYHVHQSALNGDAWEMFVGLRQLWWQHVRNDTSREPLFLTPVDAAADIRPENPARSTQAAGHPTQSAV